MSPAARGRSSGTSLLPAAGDESSDASLAPAAGVRGSGANPLPTSGGGRSDANPPPVAGVRGSGASRGLPPEMEPLQVGIAPVVARGPLQVVVISTLARVTQLVALASSELARQALPLAPAVQDLIQHLLPAESLLQSEIMQSGGSTSRVLSCMFLVLLDALHPET